MDTQVDIEKTNLRYLSKKCLLCFDMFKSDISTLNGGPPGKLRIFNSTKYDWFMTMMMMMMIMMMMVMIIIYDVFSNQIELS